MENRVVEQTGNESKTRLVEQINACLRSGDYSRALDRLRTAAHEFPNDAQFSELEKRAQDGLARKAEADRLITESQDLFARRKSAEAIQLLRQAYELDKHNSLARTILANALVEHAQSVVESDWLEAEKLTNQALALNPAHPTAKTVLSRIVEQKEKSSVDDWVSQAQKLHSSGDLFAALAWVAEGLAVHPNDPKLLQIQDAIQRDQSARRRQSRRRDLQDLRRIELEIVAAEDPAAKQALAERVQAMAAKYWTDGEILAIANGLLNRLGLAPEEASSPALRRKGGTVIFHVPRPSAAKPAASESSQLAPSLPPANPDSQKQTETTPASPPTKEVIPQNKIPARIVPPRKLRATSPPLTTSPQPPLPPLITSVPAAQPAAPALKTKAASPRTKQPARSHTRTIAVVCVAAVILVTASLFLARKFHTVPIAAKPTATPTVTAPSISTPAPAAIAERSPEASPASLPAPSDTSAASTTPPDQAPAPSGRNLGTLLVIAGQDDARVLLNGKQQPQLTKSGQLRIENLDARDYVVQVFKAGFQDPPQQKIRIRKDQQARLIFNLQPQPSSPHPASLSIQGGTPGTAVFVDQTSLGTVPSNGALTISTINPGDHTIELRKDRFRPRQFAKRFGAGATITLAAPDATLEAAPAQVKITFTPADANVALVKGDVLKIVSSSAPLELDPGTYTLTARTAERFTRSATVEVIAGQSKSLDLVLAPNGMSKWDNPGAWKREGDAFTRKGGDFVLYGVVPTAGTFSFSAMPAKGHRLQWVLNYTDPKNYLFFEVDENNFYRSVIRNGERTDEIIIPHIADKKGFRTVQVRVTATEIVHQIKQGESWKILDRWTQPGTNLSQGKFGFYIPGNDQIAVSSFSHYADLNVR